MEKTREKLAKIFDEIGEDTVTIGQSSGKLSTGQVVSILLQEGARAGSPAPSPVPGSSSRDVFDMRELARWRGTNNQLYEIRYYRELETHRKALRKVVLLGKRIVRKLGRFLVEPICQDQTSFNASVTASINALYNNEVVTNDFIKRHEDDVQNAIAQIHQEYNGKLQEYNGKLQEYENQIRRYDELLDRMEEEFQEKLEQQKTGYEAVIRSLRDECDASINRCIEEHRNMISQIETNWGYKVDQVEADYDRLIMKILKELREKQPETYAGAAQAVKTAAPAEKTADTEAEQEPDSANTYEKIDYFNFENHFRGSRRSIKERQSIYVKYFKNHGTLVDVGCGRGEFLELAKENGIKAVGVDMYQEFADYCRLRDLDVVCGDGVAYVHGLEDESVGGIFAGQIAEHLATDDLIHFCNDAYKKLTPGGYVILETPNPTSLAIYTNWFYVDPSHNKPVHPLTLEYFLKQAGFSDIEVLYTEQSKPDFKIPELHVTGAENLEEFNNGMKVVSNVLFGSQDYAIIARK
jgi:O-antigen chain-terminating methyltransferase